MKRIVVLLIVFLASFAILGTQSARPRHSLAVLAQNSVEQQLQQMQRQREEQQREQQRRQQQEQAHQRELQNCQAQAQAQYDECRQANPNGYCVIANCE